MSLYVGHGSARRCLPIIVHDVGSDASARRWLPTVACDVGAEASADVGCQPLYTTSVAMRPLDVGPNVNTSYDGCQPPSDFVGSMYDVGLLVGSEPSSVMTTSIYTSLDCLSLPGLNGRAYIFLYKLKSIADMFIRCSMLCQQRYYIIMRW